MNSLWKKFITQISLLSLTTSLISFSAAGAPQVKKIEIFCLQQGYCFSGRFDEFERLYRIDLLEQFPVAFQAVHIKEINKKEKLAPLGSPRQRLTQFLGLFLPVGEAIGPVIIDLSDQLGWSDFLMAPLWVSICEKIGSEHEGHYTASGKKKIYKAIVGKTDTKCFGRCGPACNLEGPQILGKYTQECFNHDLCNRTEGTQLGECTDEWKAAAAGFLMAPDCR